MFQCSKDATALAPPAHPQRNRRDDPYDCFQQESADRPRSGDAPSVHVHRNGFDLFGGYDAWHGKR